MDGICIPERSSCFWRWVPVDQAIFICNNSPIKNSGLLANVPAMPGLHYYYLFCGHWCPRTWGDTDHRSLTPNFPQEWVIRRDQSSKRIHLFFLNGTKAIKSLGLCKIFAWSYKNYNFKDIWSSFMLVMIIQSCFILVFGGIFIPNPPLFHNMKWNLPTGKKIS